MANKLRPSLSATFYPGTGVPPEEVEIQETDITPYLYIPGLAEEEAALTKARYGGKAIQDVEPEKKTPAEARAPFQKPDVRQPAKDFSNRSGFEQAVFKQLGGNPFEINVAQEVDRLSKEDLPGLFDAIFKGRVTWEDRDKLDKAQAQHWANEMKRYRAHIKERVSADRQTGITQYNHLMNRFDNEAKEQAAAMKRVKEKHDLWVKTVQQPKEKKQKLESTLNKEKAQLLKRMTSLAAEGYTEAGMETKEAMTELQAIRARLQEINNELYKDEIRGATEHEETKLEQKKGPAQAKKKPAPKPKSDIMQPKTGQRRVVRTGTYQGRKVVQYDDGTIEYAS